MTAVAVGIRFSGCASFRPSVPFQRKQHLSSASFLILSGWTKFKVTVTSKKHSSPLLMNSHTNYTTLEHKENNNTRRWHLICKLDFWHFLLYWSFYRFIAASLKWSRCFILTQIYIAFIVWGALMSLCFIFQSFPSSPYCCVSVTDNT